MGCDIHCYVEHRREGRDGWTCFGRRINPGRNYSIFARLAGVRNYEKVDSIAASRGVPSDLSSVSRWDNTCYISDEEGDGNTTIEKANRWIAEGSSEALMRDGRMYAVTHPDWHSHSWATTSEVELALEGVGVAEPEWLALVAAMKSLEQSGREVRLVFCFDN